jgi:hypothetical protein
MRWVVEMLYGNEIRLAGFLDGGRKVACRLEYSSYRWSFD